MTKSSGIDRIVEVATEKRTVAYKRKPINISADFFSKNFSGQREWHDIFKVLKEKENNNNNNKQPKILYPARLPFRIEGEIKSFPDKNKNKNKTKKKLNSSPPTHPYKRC